MIHDSLERELKIPDLEVPNVTVRTVRLDGLLFLVIPDWTPYWDAPSELKPEYSCLAERLSSTTPVHILHWIGEYDQEGSGKRQALMGLVSGLNQRLALGIKNQFVFASIHEGSTGLEVVAAIWKDDQVCSQAFRLGQPLTKLQIRVYSLGYYSMLGPLDMLKFYFLHRAIKRLGLKYHEAISDLAGFPTVRLRNFRGWTKSTPPGPAGTSRRRKKQTNILSSASSPLSGIEAKETKEPFQSDHSDEEGMSPDLAALRD